MYRPPASGRVSAQIQNGEGIEGVAVHADYGLIAQRRGRADMEEGSESHPVIDSSDRSVRFGPHECVDRDRLRRGCGDRDEKDYRSGDVAHE